MYRAVRACAYSGITRETAVFAARRARGEGLWILGWITGTLPARTMAKEIERKFLPKDDGWRAHAAPGKEYRQGYVCKHEGRTVRVRVAGDRAFLTLKGPTLAGTR